MKARLAIALGTAFFMPLAKHGNEAAMQGGVLRERFDVTSQDTWGYLSMSDSNFGGGEFLSSALLHRVLAVEDSELCEELGIASRDAENAVNEAVGQLIRLMGEIDGYASGPRMTEIHSLLNGIVVSFQFQDLHKQRLEHVADRLRQRANAASNGPEALANYLRTSPTEVNRRRRALFLDHIDRSSADDQTLFEAA